MIGQVAQSSDVMTSPDSFSADSLDGDTTPVAKETRKECVSMIITDVDELTGNVPPET